MAKTFTAAKINVEENAQLKLIEEVFRPLQQQDLFDGLLLPRKTSAGGLTYSLFKEEIPEDAVPVSPVQPVNAAELVSDLTFKEPSDKVAVLLKPCEIRALVELEKLQQIDLDHLFIIGIDCIGTCEREEFKKIKQQNRQNLLEEYIAETTAGKVEVFPLREACDFCYHPVSPLSDINIGLLGSEEGTILLEANSEEGQEIMEKLDIPEVDVPEQRQEMVEQVASQKKDKWQKTAEEFEENIEDISALIETLDLCRGCYNCRTACPICYCRECVFTTITFEHEGRKYVEWAERKGAIKMPTDILLFHITRMNHMGLGCIACGQCESACPSDIPLLKIFKLIGEEAQEFFAYLPGQDLEEPFPLTTFEEDEFESCTD